MSCVRGTTLTFCHVLISPGSQNLVQAITPILSEIIRLYFGGTYIRSSKSVTCKKDNSCVVLFLCTLLNKFL